MIPYDDMATDTGFTNLGPATEEFALNAVCVTISAERGMVTAFLQALAEAAEWFRGHVEEAAEIAAEVTSIEPGYALRSSGLIPPDGPEGPDPIAAAVDYSYL